VLQARGQPERAIASLLEAIALERELNTEGVRQRTAKLEHAVELAQAQSALLAERQQRLEADLKQSKELADARDAFSAEHEQRLETELRAEGELAASRAQRLAELRTLAWLGGGFLIAAALAGWALYWSKRKALLRLEVASAEIRGLQDERIRAAHLESLGMLAGGIAHDFNNALTVVLGNVSLARRTLASQPDLADELQASEAAIDQAARLARQLLAFAKGGAPARELSALGPLAREAATIACMGSSARLEIDLADDLWLAEVDRGQFLQIISNLVLNAVQAMPDGGEVTVSARNVPAGSGPGAPSWPMVRIDVEDTGPGIETDLFRKVFDPYFTTKPAGTGLGLTTVRAIVLRHKGEVRLERPPGGGARFVILLPATPDGLLPAPAPRAVAEEPALGPARILVLDDEAAVRELYERMLTRLGLEFVLASDGASAIAEYMRAQASGRPFDLLILDLTLPGGNGGLAVLEAVRELDPGARALVASGYSDSDVLEHPARSGFTGALAKPFTLAELAHALRAALPQRADRTSVRARSRS
jgi:signal transduction histidine kinase/ActR/RegA family two-component response regulator